MRGWRPCQRQQSLKATSQNQVGRGEPWAFRGAARSAAGLPRGRKPLPLLPLGLIPPGLILVFAPGSGPRVTLKLQGLCEEGGNVHPPPPPPLIPAKGAQQPPNTELEHQHIVGTFLHLYEQQANSESPHHGWQDPCIPGPRYEVPQRPLGASAPPMPATSPCWDVEYSNTHPTLWNQGPPHLLSLQSLLRSPCCMALFPRTAPHGPSWRAGPLPAVLYVMTICPPSYPPGTGPLIPLRAGSELPDPPEGPRTRIPLRH